MKKAILQIFTAILALGLLCGAATAAPSIIRDQISPSPDNNVNGTVGDSQQFIIPLNETANVTWKVDGNTPTTNQTDSNHIATLNHIFQPGKYQVTATVQGTEEQVVWTVNGAAEAPVITLSDPSSSSVSDNIGASRTFTATVSHASNITWSLDNTFIRTDSMVTTSSYTNSSATQGTHIIKVDAQNENGNATSKSWTWTVNGQSANNSTGNRIWDESKNMPTTYTWNAQSFSGFYYDLDSGVSSENMTIKDIGRSIKSGNIEYVTSPATTNFKYTQWGTYRVIGFMAEKYFAGYTKNSLAINDNISPISNGILSKLLIDSNDKKSVSSGQSLVLEEGYSLNIKEVDVNGNSVWVQLEKDGKVVDDGFVSSNQDYVYKTDLGKATDVPLIIIHFGGVFSGTESSATFVQGIFQISENYVEVKDGDDFGEMEVKSVGDEIRMENSNDVGLSRGDTVDLMGKIKIQVADDSKLRFAPVVDTSQAGTYELRGTVYDEKVDTKLPSWTPLNFEGFYYNIDEGIGTESLSVVGNLKDRTIPSDELVYQSQPQTVNFKHKNWGNFTVVGFMGDKYFAGYPDRAVNGAVDHVSVLSNDILSKILTDSDDKASMSSGSALPLQGGYSLNVKEVDVNGNSVWVQLEKDGKVVDDGFVSSGQDYVYKTDIGKATSVPLIIVHFGSVFSGAETSAVFVQGIFQISDDYTEIKNGDDFDKMEVTDVSEDGIKMKNKDDIGLGRDENITIMNNVSFKTADDSTLRFYPYVEVQSGGSANGLNIGVPDEIAAGNTFDITITADGKPVEGVSVKVDGNATGNTSTDGTVQYTAANEGTLKITAEKTGYSTVTKNVNIIPPKDEMSLVISPEKVYIGDNITIAALKKIGGDPIEGANITIDGQPLGATGSDGKIAYKADKNGTIKVLAVKQGFNNNSIAVKVRDLEAIFTVSNLTVNPMEIGAGKNATISATIVNTGNAAGKYNASLSINGNETDSKEVSIDAGGNKTVTFAHSEEKPGNYTAELGGQTITYKVKENSPILLYALGAVVLLLIGGAAYYFTKGGGDIGAMQEKVQELISSIKLKK